MALIEQFCHRQVRSIQSLLPDLNDWQYRVRSRVLHYVHGSEAQPQPTSSALILLLKAVADFGATAYRHYAPVLRERAGEVTFEPAALRMLARDVPARLRQEAHLHQEIFARAIRSNAYPG